jgi:Holliday junction resolvasome RuvABC endonuclease subunit
MFRDTGVRVILALDPSLTSTGWARYADGETTLGTIAGEDSGMARLEKIRRQVASLAGEAGLVVIEGYSFASRGRAIVSLGELGGVLRHWLHTEGPPWAEIPPASRCKYATGKGNASKEAVLVAAVKRLDYGGHSHDEADALWLLQMALTHYQIPGAAQVPKAHRVALDGIEWPRITERAA